MSKREDATQAHTPVVVLLNRIRELESFAQWAANVVHQNYHPSGCGWRECTKAFCYEARKVLKSSTL